VVAPAPNDALHQAGHGKMAWLVPPNEPAPLARAIAEGLALSPQERRILAPHAIALVRARFSQHLMRRQTLQVYDELLKSRQPARGRSGDPTALVSSP
jgi:glycosyltransferase involved in cell wall biosynthesis